MKTNDIMESLNLAAATNRVSSALVDAIVAALMERDELRAKHGEFMEAYKIVIDEQYCTCVPFLRMEIERLRGALRQISDMSGETSIWNMCGEALGEVAE